MYDLFFNIELVLFEQDGTETDRNISVSGVSVSLDLLSHRRNIILQESVAGRLVFVRQAGNHFYFSESEEDCCTVLSALY